MKTIKDISLVLTVLFGSYASTFACSLCKSSIETATESQSIAEGLNLAIIVLLIPPLLVFGAIFFAAYKSDKEIK